MSEFTVYRYRVACWERFCGSAAEFLSPEDDGGKRAGEEFFRRGWRFTAGGSLVCPSFARSCPPRDLTDDRWAGQPFEVYESRFPWVRGASAPPCHDPAPAAPSPRPAPLSPDSGPPGEPGTAAEEGR